MSARDIYRQMGSAIAFHMAPLSLACVALGVLAPSPLSRVEAVVSLLFAVITFQGALGNTFDQVADAFRRPVPMLSILAVSSVLMPALACALGTWLFGSSPQIVCGIVLEYSVPVAVISIMWVGLAGGNGALGLAAVLVSTLLSPVTIPVGMKLLLGQTVQVDVAGMMADMVEKIAIPALLGTVVNDRTHGWGKTVLSPAMAPACRLMMLMVIAGNATTISGYMRHLTPLMLCVIAFIGAFASTGYLWGIFVARLLRRDRADTATMCYCCGMRNISSGAVIAAQYFPGEAMFPVMMGTLFQQVLAASFGTLLDHLPAEKDLEPTTATADPVSNPAPTPSKGDVH